MMLRVGATIKFLNSYNKIIQLDFIRGRYFEAKARDSALNIYWAKTKLAATWLEIKKVPITVPDVSP